MTTAILVALLVAALTALFLVWRQKQALLEEYAPVIDARSEVRRAKEEAARTRASAKADAERTRSSAKSEMDALRSQTMTDLAALHQQRADLSKDYSAAREV